MMGQQNPIQGVQPPQGQDNQGIMAQMMEMAKKLSPEELQQMLQMMSKMMGG